VKPAVVLMAYGSPLRAEDIRPIVADTDMVRPGIRSIRSRDSVVFPAPDGDDSTNISPRRSTPSKP